MFFHDAPIDTVNYMIFGFVVIFGTMITYLVSMYVRQRNLKQDLEMLEELETQEK